MKIFNGSWILVSQKPCEHRPGYNHILVMNPNENLYDRFVTAIAVPYLDTWVLGRYFHTIEAAVTDYSER